MGGRGGRRDADLARQDPGTGEGRRSAVHGACGGAASDGWEEEAMVAGSRCVLGGAGAVREWRGGGDVGRTGCEW